jgi:Domain of unknown function (DUF4258)
MSQNSTDAPQWQDCDRLVFSGHAIQQMFYRRISREDVRAAITYGEILEEYPDDQPYPCCLILDYAGGIPLHVVFSHDPITHTCYVVTAYIPDPKIWSDDFQTRR